MNTTGTLKVTTPTDRQIQITRIFDAPRRVVFEAMSRPDLIRRWLHGPEGWTMVVCENEMRVGGSFRWAWRSAQGQEMAMHGVYREIAAPERIVRTESFDLGCETQAGEQLATMVLTEQQGKTMLTLTLLYPSKEARDGTIASGMERGVAASYDRLAELLATAPVGEESEIGA
jgi:uncharacterized protein YndB with AHSA1/START domain